MGNMNSENEIGTRPLGRERWEAFYINPDKNVNSSDWLAMEGTTEDEAIKNLKEKYGK